MARTIDEIVQIIERDDQEIWNDEEFWTAFWEEDIITILEHPELVENPAVAEFMEYLEFYDLGDCCQEICEQIVRNPEWLEIENLRDGLGWAFLEFFDALRGKTWRDDLRNEMEKHSDFHSWFVIPVKAVSHIEYLLFPIFDFINETPELIFNDDIKRALLSRADDIAELLRKEGRWDYGGYIFLGVLESINNIKYLFDSESIRTACRAKASYYAEVMWTLWQEDYKIEESVEMLLGLSPITENFDIKLCILNFVRDHLNNGKNHGWLQKIANDTVLGSDPLISRSILQREPNFFEEENLQLLDDAQSTDRKAQNLTGSDLEDIRKGIRKSSIPWVAGVELYHLDNIFSNDTIKREMQSRFSDIAEEIRKPYSRLDIVLYIYRNPFLMKSQEIRRSMEEKQGALLSQIWFFNYDEAQLFEGIVRNELHYDSMIRIGNRLIEKKAKTVAISGDHSQIDLMKVSELPQMRTLNLEDINLETVDLSSLANCQQLNMLKLSGNHLSSVDLTPLSGLENLSILEIADNQLNEVDLSPLAGMNLDTISLAGNNLSELKLHPFGRSIRLYLSRNDLKSIDLSNLSSCDISALYVNQNQLHELNLSHMQDKDALYQLNASSNQLKSIDLSPLSKCKYLSLIDLSDNQLESFDTSHLRGLENLNLVNLQDNPMHAIDITPIADEWTRGGIKIVEQRPELSLMGHTLHLQVSSDTKVVIDEEVFSRLKSEGSKTGEGGRIETVPGIELSREVVEDSGWPSLKTRLEGLPVSFVVSALGMPEFYGLLSGSSRLLDAIPDDADFAEGQEAAYDLAMELVQKQVEEKGPTFDLDIERMKETRAAVLIPSILENRKGEIESIELDIPTGKSRLWVKDLRDTYYGRKILSELDIGSYASAEEVDQIRAILKKTGITLANSK